MKNKKINKYIIALATLVSLTTLPGTKREVLGAPVVKTKTVIITEGDLDNPNLLTTVTIPNVKSAKVKTVSAGGNATLSISGNNVTVSAKGGTPTRVVNNPKKEGKDASDSRTMTTSTGFPTNVEYSENGFVGTLLKKGGTTSEVEQRSQTETGVRYAGTSYDSDTGGYDSSVCPTTYNYNNSGYKGNLPMVSREDMWERHDTASGYNINTEKCTYKGKVYKNVDVYRQDYSGTVYKAGNDNYYSYTVVLEYIDNTAPTIIINTSTAPQSINKDGTITISGTVTDPDTEIITISATIGGELQSTTIQGPANKRPWTLTWNGTDVTEGTTTLVVITVKDGANETATANYTGKIIVDKTKPTINIKIN